MRFLLVLLLSPLAMAQYVPSFGVVPARALGPVITQVGGCVNSASSTTTSCTSSPSATSGNILVAVSKAQNSSGTGTPTFTTTGATCVWRLLVPPTIITSGNSYNAAVYGCALTSSGTAATSVTWAGTTSGPFTDISISEWHSTATWNATLFDRSIVNANTTSSTSCPTGTTALATSNPYDLILGICENFNSAQTWGALSGWTNSTTSSRNTTGVYSKATTTKATQTATIPFSASDTSTGMLVALQATNNINCASCTYVQSENSAGETGQYDHIALSGVVPGDTLVYYVFHNNWSGSGTTTMTDSSGTNIWYPCNTNTGGATSVTMTDIQFSSSFGMSCFYSIAVATGGTVTGEPTATDCAVSCTFVGGVFIEYSGPGAWEGFSTNAASSTTSPDNMNCGSLTTATANDLIVCGTDALTGTPTAGSVPVSFTLRNTTNGAIEDGVWTGSGTTAPTQSLAASGVTYGAMGVAFR